MSIPDSSITRTHRNARDAPGPRTAQRRKRGAPPRQDRTPGSRSGSGSASRGGFAGALVRTAELAACGVVSMAIIFVILAVVGALALAYYKL